MAELKNHPGYWLRDDAAAAFDAWEDKYGVHTVNDAGRSVETQQGYIDRWNAGGTYNRPPYLYKPADPPETSPHVIDGGIAVDLGDWQRALDTANEFGFYWYGSGDPVHFNFRGWNGSSGGGPQFNAIVQQEQVFLNAARGEHLDTDGLKGPATTAAYKRYQEFLKSRGWYDGEIDGIWGGGTQAGHAKYYAEWDAQRQAGKSPKTNPADLTYADIQTALNRHGYNLVVDNIWGPKSSAALADFQSKNGLVVDRIVGSATWAKLNA